MLHTGCIAGFECEHTDENIVEFRVYRDKNEMFRVISKILCFGDIDDTYEVGKIFLNVIEVIWVGWEPKMLYRFVYKDTGEIAWENYFPHWEH